MNIRTVKKILPAVLLSLLCGCASEQVVIEPCQVSGVPAVRLKNDCISAEIAPECSGIFSALRMNGSPAMIAPVVYRVEEDDLLPPEREQNAAGGRAALWGFQIRPYSMTLQRSGRMPDGSGLVEMDCRHWLGQPLTMTRTIRLHPGETRFLITTTVKNSADAEQQISLWENFVGLLRGDGLADELLFPVKGGVSRIGNYGVKHFKSDALFRKVQKLDKGSYKIAVREPWAARSRTGAPLLVLRAVRLGPQGFFYTWSGTELEHTTEAVQTSAAVPPGGTCSFEVEYLVFPEMPDFRGLCGDSAVGMTVRENQVVFTLAACRRLEAGEFRVAGLGAAATGVIEPGKTVQVSFPRPEKWRMDVPVCGTFQGVNFTLLPLFP